MVFDLFKRKSKKIVLTVLLDGRKIAEVTQIPTEIKPVIQLNSDDPTLTFIDSEGKNYIHDLSSVIEENCMWVHLSIRVLEGYACQADCLISDTDNLEDDSFQKGEVKGIRFQPFYLSECEGNPEELVGQSLFYRGLHFSGTITQGNVSLSCICDFCQKSFRLQSFHAGFGDNSYFYCSNEPHTLVISSHIKGAPAPLSQPDTEALLQLEKRLPKCDQCGGDFKYNNSFLCPHCLKPFIDFGKHPEIRGNEYYGNTVYGQKYQEWEDEKANK